MIRLALSRALRQLVLVPIVALASYYLMAALPVPTEEESKRQLSAELVESYRRDLGLGSRWASSAPWEKLVRGERLGHHRAGRHLRGAAGEALRERGIGLVGLALALLWRRASRCSAPAAASVGGRGGRAAGRSPSATPAFIPALLLAPAVVERGHLLPELAAALVVLPLAGRAAGDAGGGRAPPGALPRLRPHRGRQGAPPRAGGGAPRAAETCSPRCWTRSRRWPPRSSPAPSPPSACWGCRTSASSTWRRCCRSRWRWWLVATTVFAALLVVVTLAVEVARLVVDPRARGGRLGEARLHRRVGGAAAAVRAVLRLRADLARGARPRLPFGADALRPDHTSASWPSVGSGCRWPPRSSPPGWPPRSGCRWRWRRARPAGWWTAARCASPRRSSRSRTCWC